MEANSKSSSRGSVTTLARALFVLALASCAMFALMRGTSTKHTLNDRSWNAIGKWQSEHVQDRSVVSQGEQQENVTQVGEMEENEGQDVFGEGALNVEAATALGVHKLSTSSLLMHKELFGENPELGQEPTTHHIDAPVRLDLDGNKDLLRRASCLVPDANGVSGGLSRSQSVKDFKGDVCTIRYSYPPVLIKQLPAKDADWRFETCALVGNAGRLLAAEQGEEIDAHQVVLRMNLAPTEGWELHVGSKTTFNMANHFHVSRLAWPGKHLKGHDITEVRSGRDALKQHSKNIKEILLLFESTQYKAYYRLWEPLLKRFPAQRLAILSPEFVTSASELWWLMLEELAAEGLSSNVKRRSDGTCAKHKDGSFAHNGSQEATCARPLSGWFALAFASRVCKHTDVYGFNTYNKRNVQSYVATNNTRLNWPYHYFDNVEGETGTHNFDVTIKVIELLSEHVNITLI